MPPRCVPQLRQAIIWDTRRRGHQATHRLQVDVSLGHRHLGLTEVQFQQRGDIRQLLDALIPDEQDGAVLPPLHRGDTRGG
ncbi:MAG: hypothetical protein GEU78_19550 [Actinobacteria bacterium]|nr:hypothetical protein [Actinomycetota bacterium]